MKGELFHIYLVNIHHSKFQKTPSKRLVNWRKLKTRFNEMNIPGTVTKLISTVGIYTYQCKLPYD